MPWLFEHFFGCEAPSDVVNVAAKNGHPEMLQFLILFKSEAEDIGGAKGVGTICQHHSSGAKSVVHWGIP